MKYIIDSSAWIEYLEGSSSGEIVNDILEGKNEIYVIPIIISEVVSFVKRKNKNFETAYHAILKNSKILDITPIISKEAGILHADKKERGDNFPLADSIIISTTKNIGAKLITKDTHFKQFKEAQLI